eukprot:TRINITY_DN5171_c0_g2_i1.p1 TRINITY_DN5171_c0_g2~~TRINITY_DN5171_c0_g2_i1.p1  ORF type:complete len:187 (+),score=24.37 TRINITY_DN5171_c0_g2_i1:30-563(+)
MSYFVGHKAVKDGYSEDAGFAINGGKGWSDVVFDNHKIEINGNVAIAMGNYYFTSAADGSEVKVEYTFGYKKFDNSEVRIFLHHSSVPYSAGPATSSNRNASPAALPVSAPSTSSGKLLVSPVSVARTGNMSSLPATRPISMALSPSQAASPISLAPTMVSRSRLNTPSSLTHMTRP